MVSSPCTRGASGGVAPIMTCRTRCKNRSEGSRGFSFLRLLGCASTVITRFRAYREQYICELEDGRREERPNGLELSCPAARATALPLSHILAGQAPHPFRPTAGSAAA